MKGKRNNKNLAHGPIVGNNRKLPDMNIFRSGCHIVHKKEDELGFVHDYLFFLVFSQCGDLKTIFQIAYFLLTLLFLFTSHPTSKVKSFIPSPGEQ
jgi:hypothetical protein